MTPATGATGKPLSFTFWDSLEKHAEGFDHPLLSPQRRKLADPADCAHTERRFKAGAWKCKRCGEPRP